MDFVYDANYARQYIQRTLGAPYTQYKNRKLAQLCRQLGMGEVYDLGANVSGIMKVPGSLRYQLHSVGITYVGVDVVPEYFTPQTAQGLGIPEAQIYPEVRHHVAHIESLPLEESSIDGIVCADVIEHIPQPEQAFSEIARVLRSSGKAIFVIPSLYKLDVLDLDTVHTRRPSSHESKLTLQAWQRLWEQAGLREIPSQTQPLGIASGLSYLSWLQPEMIPIRPDSSSSDEYSEQGYIHKHAKAIFAQHDEELDLYLQSDGLLAGIFSAIQDKDIGKALQLLEKATQKVMETSSEIDAFFMTMQGFAWNTVCPPSLSNLSFPSMLGNSIVVVLEKRH